MNGQREQILSSRSLKFILSSIILAVIIFTVYLPTAQHQFINFDDDVYVTDNANVATGITRANVSWAFTSIYAANWHPVTWLSHMLDVRMYGMNPYGHHLSSVIIHAGSSLLLFLLLSRFTGTLWQSLFVAALFALHPAHVESVAWIAERKDVLSAFFGFLTLLFYMEFTQKHKAAWYVFSFVAFILGLMSKPMLVTVPLIMLLLDFWPLNRWQVEKQGHGFRGLLSGRSQLVKEKIPFLICSLLVGVITIYAQNRSGAISSLEAISFQHRLGNALVAYVKYVGMAIWPRDLALLYPFSLSIPSWQIFGSLFALAGITGLTIRNLRQHPYVVTGWFWFLITLLPVIGFIQVGSQSMADRYTYLPFTGLFIIVAWGVPHLLAQMRNRLIVLVLLFGATMIAAIGLTWRQLGYWQNSITLCQHTLRINPNISIIHNNFGQALAAAGEQEAAINEFQQALLLHPGNAAAHSNLCAALAITSDLDEALKECQEALRLEPSNSRAHFNLGRILQLRGDMDASIQEYRAGIKIDPGNRLALDALEQALRQK